MNFALHHITETFESNEAMFPDLMEPYSSRLGEAESDEERLAIMRAGLRETICRRVPLAEARSVVGSEPDRQGALGL